MAFYRLPEGAHYRPVYGAASLSNGHKWPFTGGLKARTTAPFTALRPCRTAMNGLLPAA
jgi:hypothetical protein